MRTRLEATPEQATRLILKPPTFFFFVVAPLLAPLVPLVPLVPLLVVAVDRSVVVRRRPAESRPRRELRLTLDF